MELVVLQSSDQRRGNQPAKITIRTEHGSYMSVTSLTVVCLLRLEILHAPSRRLSQPANLTRAVSAVDVETIDVDVAMRTRGFFIVL